MDGICFSDKFANPDRFGFIEIEFRDIARIEIHAGLTIPILFEDLRTVADLRHPSPEFSHGRENPRLLSGWQARWRCDGAQFRDRLAAAFDYDNAPA